MIRIFLYLFLINVHITHFRFHIFCFQSQELKDLVWSFVRTGVRHPKLFRSVAEHLVGKGDHQKMTGRGMSEFNTQGLANIAYSYARHAQLGEETMDKYKYNCGLPYTAGKLACYAIAYLDVGEGLLRKLYVEIARANIVVHGTYSGSASTTENWII